MNDSDRPIFTKPPLAGSFEQLLGAIIGVGPDNARAHGIGNEAAGRFKPI